MIQVVSSNIQISGIADVRERRVRVNGFLRPLVSTCSDTTFIESHVDFHRAIVERLNTPGHVIDADQVLDGAPSSTDA